jgi:hypothetical protein
MDGEAVPGSCNTMLIVNSSAAITMHYIIRVYLASYLIVWHKPQLE